MIRRAVDERVIRRRDYDVGDDDIDYGGMVNAARGGLTALKKHKKLRAGPSITSRVVAHIPKGRIVTVQQDPSRAGRTSRSWAKVQVRMNGTVSEGYINTQDPTEDMSVQDTAVTGPIMDPVDGPQPEDVAQHMLGTCFLLSSLMSLTRNQPNYVRDRLFAADTPPTEEHESYKVVFHRAKLNSFTHNVEPTGATDSVTVRATILTNSGRFVDSTLTTIDEGSSIGSAGTWPWPAIVEKAFLAWPKRLQIDHAEGGQSFRAAMYLTGEQYDTTESLTGTDEADPQRVAEVRLMNKNAIIQACQGDGIVTAATLQQPPDAWVEHNVADGRGSSGNEPKIGGICFQHVYEVVRADETHIHLRNPWGHYGRVNGEVDPDAAVSVLTWDEFWMVSGSGDATVRTPTDGDR